MAESKTVEGFLVEAFGDAKDGKPIDPQVVEEKLNAWDNKLMGGEFDANDIDYNAIVEHLMPQAMYDAFYHDTGRLAASDRRLLQEQANKAISNTHFDVLWDRLITRHMRDFVPSREMSLDEALRVLQEEGVAPITATQVDRFRSRCQTRQVADFSCPPAATAFDNIFTRVNMPCSDFSDNKVCEFPLDPPPEFCCNDTNDDDPATFYGLGPERCWKMPKPCFISFAFGMHRNLVCVNANDFVRSQIEARRAWFSIIDERKRTRLLFNAYSSEDCDRHTYNYDGVTYPSGWMAASEGGPWTNVLTDPALSWSTCSEGPMCAIEQVFEDMRDPVNEFPVECGGNFEVILTRDCKKYQFWEVLGARTYERSISGDCCGTAAAMRAPRDGWSTSFRYSRWAWDILVDFYLNHYTGTYNGTPFDTLANRLPGDPTLAQRTAEYYAENTYVVSKGLSRTFGTIVDYDVSERTIEGTNTWMYFDRGIRWARRYDRKQTDAWLRPWLTLLVRAFNPLLDADGASIP